MEQKKSAAPGSQPDATQTPCNHYFSQEEHETAVKMCQFMKNYSLVQANRLYESAYVTAQIQRYLKEAGTEGKAPEIITLAHSMDLHERG